MDLEKIEHLAKLLDLHNKVINYPQFNEVAAQIMEEATKISRELGDDPKTSSAPIASTQPKV